MSLLWLVEQTNRRWCAFRSQHRQLSTSTAPPATGLPRTESRAHPASSLDWGFATTSLQGGPDEQRAQELHLIWAALAFPGCPRRPGARGNLHVPPQDRGQQPEEDDLRLRTKASVKVLLQWQLRHRALRGQPQQSRHQAPRARSQRSASQASAGFHWGTDLGARRPGDQLPDGQTAVVLAGASRASGGRSRATARSTSRRPNGAI